MRKSKRLAYLLLFLLTSSNVWASPLFLQFSGSYRTDADDVETVTLNSTNGMFFMGATFNRQNSLYLGWSTHYWNRTFTRGVGTTVQGLTELGPRIQWYMDEDKEHYFSIAWHPYARGSLQYEGDTYNVSGYSIIGGYGYQIKVNKHLYLGASINYHTASLSSSIDVDSQETIITKTLSTILPMLELCFRF